MKKYCKLLRIKHWIKNFLVFIPFVCAKMVTYSSTIKMILAFFSFSFVSSAVYIINDIRDIEKDKLHPIKKNRPLPSGLISKKTAICIGIGMCLLSLTINTYIHHSFFNPSLYIILAYFLINLLYSFGLKNITIIDIALLASGFILRVYYGASILNVTVSDWLFLTVLSSSMFLGLGKRKKELINNKVSRKVLEQYNESFLDKFQYIMLALIFVFYSLWAIEQDSKYLVFSIPFVMLIFMRYCLIIEKSDEGDPTTILYQDKTLLLLCLLYGIIMLFLLLV